MSRDAGFRERRTEEIPQEWVRDQAANAGRLLRPDGVENPVGLGHILCKISRSDNKQERLGIK